MDTILPMDTICIYLSLYFMLYQAKTNERTEPLAAILLPQCEEDKFLELA